MNSAVPTIQVSEILGFKRSFSEYRRFDDCLEIWGWVVKYDRAGNEEWCGLKTLINTLVCERGDGKECRNKQALFDEFIGSMMQGLGGE